MTVGLEVNLASDLGEDTRTWLIPQVHWEMTDAFLLQIGPSFAVGSGRSDDVDVVFRFIWSR